MSLLNAQDDPRLCQGTRQWPLSLLPMAAASTGGYAGRLPTTDLPSAGVLWDGDKFWKPSLGLLIPCISLDPTDELPTGCGFMLYRGNTDTSYSSDGKTKLVNYAFQPFAAFTCGFADTPSADCKINRYVEGELVDHFLFNKIEQVWGPAVDVLNPYDLNPDSLDSAACMADPRGGEFFLADMICDIEADMGLFFHPL
ncbi:MAG: hypothetical protein K8R92_00735 [Planctomycetes bacterium]|nr:hypothetical protein [Planctomycetota bacterium]